jgi:hypothetical protein
MNGWDEVNFRTQKGGMEWQLGAGALTNAGGQEGQEGQEVWSSGVLEGLVEETQSCQSNAHQVESST